MQVEQTLQHVGHGDEAAVEVDACCTPVPMSCVSPENIEVSSAQSKPPSALGVRPHGGIQLSKCGILFAGAAGMPLAGAALCVFFVPSHEI